MRQRLLVGLGVATLALASVVMPLSPAFAADQGLGVHGTSPSTLVAPVSGACLPGAQQCNPVVPQPSNGSGLVLVLIGTLAGAVMVSVGRTRLRRRRHAGHLPSGFVPAPMHPPRAGLDTI